jgi:pyruvate/2-oxoglutarate dehydrogenase complex dihydrolipoamide acyltransferase (E2) component
MDPHSEHGDGSPAPGLTSAPTSDERAEAPEQAEPVAAAAPPDAAPSSAWAGAQQAGDDATPAPGAPPSSEPDPAETLSPAVRRLVRQYDLDITGVYGSGPAGKIRVGDIIGMLDGRAEPRARMSDGPSRASTGASDAGARHPASGTRRDAQLAPSEAGQTSMQSSATPEPAHAVPTTTVFECDVSRVLSHRKRERRGDVEPLLASYFIAACLEALSAVPEVTAGLTGSTQPQTAELAPRLGVALATTDGIVRRALVNTAATALDERLRAVDAQLRASVDEDLHSAHILIHYFAASGSLLATPTAIGTGHVGSLGIGRVRREVVVKTVDGQEAPRVAALCYLTLTFRPERIALERANRFVGEWVRVLEQWPIEPPKTTYSGVP